MEQTLKDQDKRPEMFKRLKTSTISQQKTISNPIHAGSVLRNIQSSSRIMDSQPFQVIQNVTIDDNTDEESYSESDSTEEQIGYYDSPNLVEESDSHNDTLLL